LSRVILALFTSLVLVAGCYDQLVPGRCTSNGDCPSGQFCNLDKIAGVYARCSPTNPDDGGIDQSTNEDGNDGGPDGGEDGGVDSGVDIPPTCDPVCTDPAKPICDTTSLSCVGCVTGGDCHDTARPVCDATTRTCVGCVVGTDCTADPSKPLCDTVAKTCVGCLAAGDCTSLTAPICDLTPHACVKCATDQQCQAKDATKPACETSTGTCFPCVDSKKHCPTTAPICDAHACRVCKKDAECSLAYGADPGLCVGGHCVTNDQVIYLQNVTSCSTTARGDGSVSSPFCFTSDAATALSVQKPTLVIRGPRPVNEPLTISLASAPVVVVGQSGQGFGTIVGSPPLVSITAGDVTLRDLQISGGPSVGVSATGGTLRMSRCLVLNNSDGGIKVSNAAFDITNTVVAGNMGGVAVSLGMYTGTGPTRFAFNTIVSNAGTGVFCGPTPYALTGLLVNGNGTQFVGTCTTDATSSTNAPQFDSTRPYHLTATSSCRDKAGTTNLPADDIDGDSRPQGVAADCGADEYAP
jgi:Cys-rich repeat protein